MTKSLLNESSATSNQTIERSEPFSSIIIFSVQCLKCWGPKLEWIGYIPTFPINQFELVECNTGLQVCKGGCNYCVNVTSSFSAKSCAGDQDEGLSMLGLHHDGCRNITSAQNAKYTIWLNKMIGELPNYSVQADFTQACRCSWDGCNGSSNGKLDSDLGASSLLASQGTAIFSNRNYGTYIFIIITSIIFNRQNKHL